MKVKDLLGQSDLVVHAVAETLTVAAAIDRMQDLKTSALIVTAAGNPVGIFSERDVIRCFLQHRDRTFNEIRLKEVMTRQLVVAEPEEDMGEAMATMLQADIKHLPVVADGRIVGILTLAALVRRQIGNLTAELHYLQDYISDLHEAGRD